MTISPLAPANYPQMPEVTGVRFGCVEAGIKYKGRKDLAIIEFDELAQIAGVFTRSMCASAPVDWCKSILGAGQVKCIVVNSGNANAFTGKKGKAAVEITAAATAEVFNCTPEQVYLASTGVIGEPLDVSQFPVFLKQAKENSRKDGWADAAKTIMTTDTYHKTATQNFEVDGQSFCVNGIAKGSGMIAPDMATMLSFLVTDFPVSNHILQSILTKAVAPTFNCITVDSDTSTSDTVLLASTANSRFEMVTDIDNPQLLNFTSAVNRVLHDLAMLVIRDGEGASKHIEICVEGADCDLSAKKIAMSIANSPLVKTAIAGEDANWGRIVMAIGKAGEPANRDLLSIWFGKLRVAFEGERDPGYSEEAAGEIMREEFIPIKVDLGIGTGKSVVWTCDLTREYVNINADYRS